MNALKRAKSEKKVKGVINHDSLRTSSDVGEDSTEKSESVPQTARGAGRIKLTLKPSSKDLTPPRDGGRERLDSVSSQKHLKMFSGVGRTRTASGSVSASDSPNFNIDEAPIIDKDTLAYLLLSSPFDNPRQATPFRPFSVSPLVYTPFDPYDQGSTADKTIKYQIIEKTDNNKTKKRDLKKLTTMMSYSSQREQFRNYLSGLDYQFYFDFWLQTNALLCGEVPQDKIDAALVKLLCILGIGGVRKIDLPLTSAPHVASLESHILAGTWNISHLQPLQEVVTDVLLQHLRAYQA